jgi:hypothetical protein
VKPLAFNQWNTGQYRAGGQKSGYNLTKQYKKSSYNLTNSLLAHLGRAALLQSAGKGSNPGRLHETFIETITTQVWCNG